MQLEWEIAIYPDQIMVLIQGPVICGELIREAFPDVPHTENFPDPDAEYSFAFSLLRSPGLAESIGYLLRTIASAQLLTGSFDRGFALDWYSVPDSNPRQRSELGQLLYQYKYQNRYGNMEELAHRLARFIRHHPLYQTADLLVPIPTNDQIRPFDLVIRLAELVGSRVQLPVFGNLLQKTRTAPKQRDLRTLEEKQQNVAGLYRCLNSSLIQGRSVVLFDDLFDNGATLDEASRVLKAAGAKACYALTITRTGRTGERVSSET